MAKIDIQERNNCIEEWEILADEEYRKYKISNSGIMAFNFFLGNLTWKQVMQSISSAYEKFPDNKDIEKRFGCFCDINLHKIRIGLGIIPPFHIDGGA
jgi:hypothetical protein